MRYYELDDQERDEHNKRLVDILSLALQMGYSKDYDTRVPYKNLEDVSPAGQGRSIRIEAVRYAVANINLLGEDIKLDNLAEMTGRFKELDLEAETFEAQYNDALEKVLKELLSLVGTRDERYDRAIFGRLWEISDGRHFISRAKEAYVFRWKSAQISQNLTKAYENGELDPDLVEKVLFEVRDSGNYDQWNRAIRDVVSLFSSTPSEKS